MKLIAIVALLHDARLMMEEDPTTNDPTRKLRQNQGEEEGEDELDKRFGVAQERNVGRLIVEIDGDRAVVAWRFNGVAHVSSPSQMPLAHMRHRERNILKDQVYCEMLGASPLNPGESGAFKENAVQWLLFSLSAASSGAREVLEAPGEIRLPFSPREISAGEVVAWNAS